jgi:hypothetical protein
MSRQEASKTLYGFEPIIQFRQLSLQQGADFATFSSAARGQQTFYLLQREPQILRLLNKPNSLNDFGWKETKTSASTKRARKQSSTLIESNSVDRGSGTFR